MKKIISSLLAVLLLCSCSANQISFSPKTDFTYDAQITLGDFTYQAQVKYKNGIVYVTPTTTHADGMTMSCDGETVTFSQKGYSHSVPVSSSPENNPARVIYEALSSLDSSSKSHIDGVNIYEGKILQGDYVLKQNSNGDYSSLEIRNISFKAEFKGNSKAK